MFLLGLGTGRCGLASLASLLNRQTHASVTHSERPLLDWLADAPLARIEARLARLSRKRREHFVGDVAPFYLPYAEAVLKTRDDLKMVCMRRGRDETVASFSRWLGRSFPLPTNHWIEEPQPGFFHDPLWTRTFPTYEANSREEAVELYWEEYYRRSERLAEQFPSRFQIFDVDALNTPQGQQEILTFCGFDHDQQQLIPQLRENADHESRQRYGPTSFSPHAQDPRRCVVLVPYIGHIVPKCEEGLQQLERRGYPVRRVSGYAAIDQGRNQLATDALLEGFEETMWIDSDVVFDPNSVDALRAHQLPVCCGVYVQKGKRAITCHVMPDTPDMVFGKDGGLTEVLYAATGFLHVRRIVYQRMQQQLKLPVCNERFGRPMIPFFQPMVKTDDDHWYLAEDFAFSERSRQCGFRIFADTRLRLWHVGSYSYGWEDAGGSFTRHNSFTLNFNLPIDAENSPSSFKVVENGPSESPAS